MSSVAAPPSDAHLVRKCVSHEEMNPRRRNTMEDVHRYRPELLRDEQGTVYSYFGIYDGHGGRQIANFLEETLEKNIAVELQQSDEASILERLTRAFLITDMQSYSAGITTSGATAVSALLKTDRDGNRSLYVANVGDSRAVLISDEGQPTDECEQCPGNFATRLSYDHRADDVIEEERIVEAGGFVTRQRVLGILAVSRAFGDHSMKDFIIASPHVREASVRAQANPILILACDGVWDVMSDREAADIILSSYAEYGEPFDNAAKLLAETALERGSMDNVTVIVVFL